MKPQEKAIELIRQFYSVGAVECKQCALIVVDEILQNFGNLTEHKQHYTAYCTIQFYKQVKKEIGKL